MQNPKRRSPEDIVAQQKRDAERTKQQKAETARAVTVKAAAPPAHMAIDTRTPEQRYVDEIAPATFAGQLVKFSKEGKFVIKETDEEISPDTAFLALCDETLIGWVKFNGDDAPPDRVQGLLYDGFVMPPRTSLGDTDETRWPEGLSGQPTDPWQHQICLVLQEPSTEALYTFATSSITGRRAVGNLLRQYDRMRKKDADSYPVVKLRPSGFQHKDDRVGWVHTPSFAVISRAPKNATAVPTLADDMNDEIPGL